MIKVIFYFNFYAGDLCIADLADYYFNLMSICDEFTLNKVYRSYKNKADRKRRALKYINRILDNFKNPIFATFTINEDNYPIDPLKFKRKLIYLLKKNNYVYYGNLDCGVNFGRLHAHVILSHEYDHVNFGYTLGNVNFKRIVTPNDIALAKYLNKLTNHSIKDSVYGRAFTNIKIRYNLKS